MAEPLGVHPDPVAPGGATELSESSDRRAPGGENVSGPSITAPSLTLGTRLENTYEVKKLLGQGAMGAVYLVEHVGLGKQFAAKVVAASRVLDDSAIARLRHEARITSAIEHENIVNVTHLGATPDGSLFIVMELLRGESLGARLRRQLEQAKAGGGPRWLPDEEVRGCVSAVLSALVAAHGAGVIHRDLKPDNVFLSQTRSGELRPKIVDFGIGKLSSPTGKDLRLTETGQTVGTPLYMAPEQFRAASEVGPPADLYALGVVIFEMVTGELPFQATHVFEMVLKHATEQAKDPRSLRPDLPAKVAELVLKCLEKEPAARFESAEALQRAWREAWSDGPNTARGRAPAIAGPGGPKPVPAAVTHVAAVRTPGALALRWWMLPLSVIAGAALVLAIDRGTREPGDEPAPDRATTTSFDPPIHEPSVSVPVAPVAPIDPAPTESVIAAPPVMRLHRITSEPAGAEVLVDGAVVAITPFELSVGAETVVTIQLRLTGRRRVERTLDPTSPDVVHVRLTREQAPTEAEPEFPGLMER